MNNIKTLQTRYGEMTCIADDFYLTRCLELYGEYGEAEVNIWRQFIRPGWHVCDIGANIGALTLPLSQIVGGQGKVYAFEPQPDLYQLLKQNTRHLSNVVLCPKALGSHSHIARMQTRAEHDAEDANSGSYCLGKGTGRVEVVKLDDWIHPTRQIDFIKIDVEGHEVEVLLGAEQTIKRCRPMLFVENHPANPHYYTLIGLLQDLQYAVWQNFSYLFQPNNFNNNPDNVFNTIGSYDLLCIPGERAGGYQVEILRQEPQPRQRMS